MWGCKKRVGGAHRSRVLVVLMKDRIRQDGLTS